MKYLEFKGQLYLIHTDNKFGDYIVYQNKGIYVKEALKIGFEYAVTLFDFEN